MENELEQKARELLAAEFDILGDREHADSIRAGAIRSPHRHGPVIRAIVAALQQAQQHRRNPAFVGEWHEKAIALGYDGVADMLYAVERGEPPLHIATALAKAAGQKAQQPGAQAVAWPSGLLDRVKAAEQRIENGHAPRRIPADPSDVDLVLAEVRCLLEGSAPPFWLKSEATAPPPLPEGVSEEDVQTAFRIIIDSSRGDPVTLSDVRTALESYRARLAARGEKGVRSHG